jgi:protein SCO1/2
MATYSAVADILKSEAKAPELRYVFVSVDPSRDEGAKLKDYVAKAPVPLIALTGDPDTIVRTSRTFGAAYEPQPKRADGSYSVRHSTDTCLVGPGGRIFKRFELGADPKEIAAAVNEFASRVPRKAVASANAASNEGGSK